MCTTCPFISLVKNNMLTFANRIFLLRHFFFIVAEEQIIVVTCILYT